MGTNTFLKDPSDVLDFQLDYSVWLNSDTISTSSWDAESGITVDSDTKTDTTTTVWLSGGAAGRRYIVTNTITTVGGRTKQQSINIVLQEN